MIHKFNKEKRLNMFLKMSQQDGTFSREFYSLQTALHVSGETFTHHQELE
jgi:hypothetical protein